MKKGTLFLTAFALSFGFVSCQKENIEPQKISGATNTNSLSLKYRNTADSNSNNDTKTRFEVNVHSVSDKPICNAYLVEVIDGDGRLIGEPQPLIPGISTYNFFEAGSGTGIRVARLYLPENGDHIACGTEIYFPPTTLYGPFETGRSYTMDLYPKNDLPE